MAELKVTLKRNIIGRPQNQHDTAKALGLTEINGSVVKPPNEAIKGMVNIVSHLVDVEEIQLRKITTRVSGRCQTYETS